MRTEAFKLVKVARVPHCKSSEVNQELCVRSRPDSLKLHEKEQRAQILCSTGALWV